MSQKDVQPRIDVSADLGAAAKRLNRRRFSLGLFVGVVGAIISICLYGWMRDRELQLVKIQFEVDANERIESLQRTVADRLGVMKTVAAFFSGSQLVERKEFRNFANPLIERHPGLEIIGWVPRIPGSHREAHEAAVRQESIPDYAIRQRDAGGQFVPEQTQNEYYPILFIAPSDTKRSLIGFDLGSNPYCRFAIDRAMSTHGPTAVISPPLDGDENDHHLLFVLEPAWNEDENPKERPADQPEIDGFVLGVYRVCTIVTESIRIFPPVGIDIYITCPTGSEQTTSAKDIFPTLCIRDGSLEIVDAMPPLKDSMHFEAGFNLANYRCAVNCIPTEFYMDRHRSWGAPIVLVTGLVITVLLVGYLILLTGRTARFELRVAERTTELQAISKAALDAVIMMDVRGNVIHWNPAAERIFGYSSEEILGRNVHGTLVPERYREMAHQGVMEFLKSGTGPVVGKVLEMEAIHKNGREFPVEISVSPIRQRDGWGAMAIIRDITDRRKAEQSLHQEQRLLREMLELHERDRKLVAYEIHDGLAQDLTGAMLKLQSVEDMRANDPIGAQEAFHDGLRILGNAMNEARQLISGLRPPVLDELGVVAAIDYLIEQQNRKEGPKIEFVCLAELDRLATPLESAIFRIVQECLTNACRYSKSPKVRVELRKTEKSVHIDVQDWGIGFDPEGVSQSHFGLRGIHERVRLLGGAIHVQTAPRQGTHITVELPLVLQAENGKTKQNHRTD